MLNYSLDDKNFVVAISGGVIRHLMGFRQLRSKDLEAGGQLFAIFDTNKIIIKNATGPRPTDRRTRFSYVPDRKAEQQEILNMYERGLHYVGDWHTHPQILPSPSGTDISNMGDCVRASSHELHGFILVIIGTEEFPKGLRVSFHTGYDEIVLNPIKTNRPRKGIGGV